MSNGECIYPGSFDPITLGHIDILKRSLDIFSVVHIAVLKNSKKKYMFSEEKRIKMICRATEDLKGVYVHAWDGLLVDFAKSIDCNVVIRGVRNYADFDFEHQASVVNRTVWDKLETLFLPSKPELACVSSSNVRELLSFGGDVSKFVPGGILNLIKQGEAK